MARFCTRCGKPLEEGEVCSCTQEAAAPQQQTAQAAAPQQQTAQTAPQQQTAQSAGYVPNEQQFQQTQQAVKGFLAKLANTFLEMLLHPVTVGKNIIQAGEFGVGIGMFVLQGIFSALFAAIIMSNTFGKLFKAMSYFDDETELSYVKIFFVTLIFSMVLSFIFALLLWVGNLIIKNKVSYQQMIVAASARSCVVIVATIIAIIVGLMNVQYGLCVFLIGNIWGFFVVLMAMPVMQESVRNKLPLIMILVYLIFLLASTFCEKKGFVMYFPGDMQEEIEDSIDGMTNIFDEMESDMF